MINGLLRWFDAAEGWGVIEAQAASGGCFVHVSDIAMDRYRVLAPGTASASPTRRAVSPRMAITSARCRSSAGEIVSELGQRDTTGPGVNRRTPRPGTPSSSPGRPSTRALGKRISYRNDRCHVPVSKTTRQASSSVVKRDSVRAVPAMESTAPSSSAWFALSPPTG